MADITEGYRTRHKEFTYKEVPLRVPEAYKYKRVDRNGVIRNFDSSSQVRITPSNGDGSVSRGGKIQFKIADDTRFFIPSQVLHKYRVVGLNAAGAPVISDTATHRLSQSGTDAVWNRASVLINGRIIEDLPNYNLFTAHENALTNWETKQHLAICEYYSPDEFSDRNEVVAKKKAYSVTKNSLSFFQTDRAIPLCLLKSGITLEMVTEQDISKVFPNNSGITSYRVEENELIVVLSQPTPEYYAEVLTLIEHGESFAIPLQTVWHQEFPGLDNRVQELSIVTGEQTSISSMMVVTSKDTATDVDKLNYSDDYAIRSAYIQVGTKRYPEGKAIGNGTGSVLDPEAYAMANRNKDFAAVAFSPTLDDYEEWELSGKKVRHWSLRMNFKESPEFMSGGLQTLSDSRVRMTLSQYPQPPETTPDFTSVASFKDVTFHVFWTTDHELHISKDGVQLLPA